MEDYICPRCTKSVWRERDRNLVEYHGRMSLVCGKPCYMTIVVTPVDKLVVRENSEGIGSFPIHTVRAIDRIKESDFRRLAPNILSHKANAVMILSTKESIIEGEEARQESVICSDESLHPTPEPEYIREQEVSIKDAVCGILVIVALVVSFAAFIYLITHLV